MKLGVVSMNLSGWPPAPAPMDFEFEEGLKYAHDLGLQAIEVGVAGLWNRKYCDPDKLLAAGQGEIDRWRDTFARYNLEISAMGGHGEPLTPDKESRQQYSREFRTACQFMEKAGIRRMTLLAGLPEGAKGDTAPNWVTFAEWPFLRDTLHWQWEKRLLPYWREHGKIAQDHGVTLCFEMMGGDMVHNPVTLKRLHNEIGPVVACNFDPSHMWYQGIDPIEALRYLGPLVQHVHVKDTLIHSHHARLRGFMHAGPAGKPEERVWTDTLAGWGHDEAMWCEFVATLRLIGYDHVLSFEILCEYIAVKEGLEKSVAFFQKIVLEEPLSANPGHHD